MSDTPTPRTDDAYTQRSNEGAWDFKVRQEKTMESLERELIAVTERRDKLDDQLDQILIRLGDTQEKMFDAEKQRDRLIKAIEPLKYWRDISECDCSNPLPQGGCLRCDLERILKTLNESKP
jgi:uncharacterized coiled-coil protein SlyX